MIVEAVPQKAAWNRNTARAQSPETPASPKRSVPAQPPAVEPYISPKPTPQYKTKETHKSARFLIAIPMLCLVRTRPPSRHRKPPCMRSTRAVQKVRRTAL